MTEQKMLPNNGRNSLSGITMGREGTIIVGGSKITQKSPLYDRLGATSEYLNPRALASAELAGMRMGEGIGEAYANAITNAVMAIRAEHPGAKPTNQLNQEIKKFLESELAASQYGKEAMAFKNAEILSLFDVYSMLGKEPELSIGQHYDLVLCVGNCKVSYPDEKARYKNKEKREVQLAALTQAEACGMVHLLLGREASQFAQERKRSGDTAAWKAEIGIAIKHYKEAVAFDNANEPAIHSLAGAYTETGQHCKAAEVYKKIIEGPTASGAKTYYSSFLAEKAIATGNIQMMIDAYRLIESILGEQPRYVQAREAAGSLRDALEKALKS
ncbi:MAG: hypothetical protein WCY41_00755 [Candidatus Micrarchaeia archaeon]